MTKQIVLNQQTVKLCVVEVVKTHTTKNFHFQITHHRVSPRGSIRHTSLARAAVVQSLRDRNSRSLIQIPVNKHSVYANMTPQTWQSRRHHSDLHIVVAVVSRLAMLSPSMAHNAVRRRQRSDDEHDDTDATDDRTDLPSIVGCS